MVKAQEITKYCQELLKTENFKDYCHNGMQVEGKENVEKIVTGVSLSEKLIKKAIEKKADMIMVHHGFFGMSFGENPVIKYASKKRLKLILENDLNVLGFHLPLDAHIEIGNNVSLAKLFALKNIKPMTEAKDNYGFIGESDDTSLADFVKLIDEKLETRSTIIDGGNKQVKKVVIVSGGSADYFMEAKNLGADTFICGELKEHVVREAEEAEINVIAPGHYNTEKTGIQNLGEKVAKEFGVEVEFVYIPNSI
ncbi:Nif3-like dinuclear metal center hexameric protein [Candidatus Parcubacteria bacterium]|nr:MAG: Nif3-like dinuclear metal center hexameric protein [Candidatus Parcubacteria bacterium]